jgi:hypothetical protein
MTKPNIMPMNWFSVEKNGMTSGFHEYAVRLLKSKVGMGLRPRPLTPPTMLFRLTLSGAIQLIQLKVDRAGTGYRVNRGPMHGP